MSARGLLLAACAFAGSALAVHAQPSQGVDAVESFAPGPGAGYGAEYMPDNVMGFPDTSAREDIPTVDPRQVLALGLGGEIVLRFASPVVNGPGPDFTVFENAFRYVMGGRERTYAEPAEVSVSSDNVTFHAFPFDSLTLAGCAGVTPTHGDADPTNPALSGGDAFDLAKLGVDSVRYVRIRDVSAIVKDNSSHPFWDATLNGFDLDAVVPVRRASSSVREPHISAVSLMPNPVAASAVLRLHPADAVHVRAVLVDVLGRERRVLAERVLAAGEQRIAVHADDLENGMYFITVVQGSAPPTTLRMMVAR